MNYYLGFRAPEKDGLTLGKKFQEVLNAKYKGEDTKPKIDEIVPKSRGLASLLLSQAYDFDDIISIDEHYHLDLGFGIPFEYAPDLVTKTKIIENKCTTGYYNAQMVGSERQRVIYYLGVKKQFGFKADVYYQIFNTKTKTCELVNAPVGPKDIDELMDWIELKLKQIEKMYNSGVYDFGFHKFCDLKKICPLEQKYGFQR